jgi:hypothetical protein
LLHLKHSTINSALLIDPILGSNSSHLGWVTPECIGHIVLEYKYSESRREQARSILDH